MVPDLLFRIRATGETAQAFGDVKRDAVSLKTSLTGITSQAGMADKAAKAFANGLGDAMREAKFLIGNILSPTSAISFLLGAATSAVYEFASAILDGGGSIEDALKVRPSS